MRHTICQVSPDERRWRGGSGTVGHLQHQTVGYETMSRNCADDFLDSHVVLRNYEGKLCCAQTCVFLGSTCKVDDDCGLRVVWISFTPLQKDATLPMKTINCSTLMKL